MTRYNKLWPQLASTVAVALVAFDVVDAGAQDAVVTVVLGLLGSLGVYAVPNVA